MINADLHTHILHDIDDGACDIDESLNLIDAEISAGINRIVLTPHFDLERNGYDDFIQRRSEKLLNLKEKLGMRKVELFCGAEVFYSEYLIKLIGINSLCIENTKYMLLEFPYYYFDKKILSDIYLLISEKGIIPIIAHIERYHYLNTHLLKSLKELGCIFQVNASSFTGFFSNLRVKKLVLSGYVDVVASDCHDITNRPPCFYNLDKIIGKDYTLELFSKFADNANLILDNKSFIKQTDVLI